METKAEYKRRRKRIGLFVLIVAVVLFVAVVTLVIVSPVLMGKKASNIELSAAPQYLPYQNSSSSIFLVSATASTGTFPLSDIVPIYPSGGPEPTPTPVIKTGNPCIIINATLQSDYTNQNPSPNQYPKTYANGTTDNSPEDFAYVYLTATIYDKAGQQITAIDVTPPYGHPNGGAFMLLHNGETDSITIYLATSRTDIDHFTVEAKYIGALALPC